ncbi:hypothetical protein GGI26_005486 [Coemansia sp. RSA 1358]|nr:hypothetical protein EDC05_005148 [Coemansia umbellata]KAJ2619867.1 hypothetical protein GGI26_005486 [Coemansia sp. RSA 1358]
MSSGQHIYAPHTSGLRYSHHHYHHNNNSHSNGAGSGSSINDGHVTPSSGSVGAYDYVQVTSLATATPAARAQHSRPPSTHPLPSPPPQCVGSSYLAVSQHEPGQTITLPPILLPVARQQASSPTSSPTLPTPSGEGKRRTSTESEQQQQQIRRAAKRKAGSEDPADATEAARILEERRRRNASASARFRKRRNERERELVSRCMFLEHHLLQSLGSGPFDQLMRKAPAASAIEGPLLGRRALDLRDMMPGDELEANDADSTARNSPSAPSEQQRLSVCALTAPKNIDDVWAAYLALSQQVAGVVQRVQTLEERR